MHSINSHKKGNQAQISLGQIINQGEQAIHYKCISSLNSLITRQIFKKFLHHHKQLIQSPHVSILMRNSTKWAKKDNSKPQNLPPKLKIYIVPNVLKHPNKQGRKKLYPRVDNRPPEFNRIHSMFIIKFPTSPNSCPKHQNNHHIILPNAKINQNKIT